MFKKPLWQIVWTQIDQTAPLGAVCSGSTLFASILYSTVMLDNYLQQTTTADDIFRCTFFLVFLGVRLFRVWDSTVIQFRGRFSIFTRQFWWYLCSAVSAICTILVKGIMGNICEKLF